MLWEIETYNDIEDLAELFEWDIKKTDMPYLDEIIPFESDEWPFDRGGVLKFKQRTKYNIITSINLS
jgi:hypothetical protein